MSGPSTLRLVCLAAMAPALTEAASSTRLKLQEPGTKHCGDSVPANIDHPEVPSFSPSETDQLSKVRNDIFGTKVSYNRSDDRLVHLSISSRKKQADQVRWHPPTRGLGSNVGSSLTSTSPSFGSTSQISITRLNELNLKKNQINTLIDLQEENTANLIACTLPKNSIQKSDIINTLKKRMNQSQLVADKDKAGIVSFNQQFTIDPKSNNSFGKISLIKHKGMVNGEGDLKGSGEKQEELNNLNGCEESGVTFKHKKPKEVRPTSISSPDNKGYSQIAPKIFESVALNNKMGMCVKDKCVPSEMDTLLKMSGNNKEESVKSCDDLRKDCAKKQVFLERKVDTLMRRLKRMKGKVVDSHTKEQLLQYVNFQHQNLQMVAKTIKNEAPGPEELKEHFLSNEEVKNMSTAQLVKLVRGCQTNKPLAVAETTSSRFRVLNSHASIMPPAVASHCLNSSEKLSARVQMAEADLDSDATASSSGGESGEEDSMSSQLNPDIRVPSLYKRAEWKWAVDRAAVVARWTWLQAQVSDLEYKIRQQSQVHRQLRNSKGGVVLGDPPSPVDILRRLQGLPPKQTSSSASEGKSTSGEGPASAEVSPCNVSAVLSNVDKQASRLTQSLHCLSPASSTIGSPVGSKISSPLVSGASESPSSSTNTEAETTAENSPLLSSSSSNFRQPASDQSLQPALDASCQAARCRPLRSYRKRKILRTIGLYKTSVKAARLSDIRCRCYPPSSSCPICGGRYNNTLTIDPDSMSLNERVALLDPSFHSVLSFSQDVHLPIHCEGLLKSGLWQNKPPPKRRTGDSRRQKVLSLVAEPVRKNGNKIATGNGRNNNAPSVINFSTKIKNKYEGKTKVKNTIARPSSLKPKANNAKVNKAKRKAAKLAREALKRKEEEENEDDLEELYLDQEVGTPSISRDHLSHSGSQSSLKDHVSSHRKRKVDYSYDINNIVIPHSIAASTRVEQIQYKEIVTPKWREVDNSVLDIGTLENAVNKQLGKTNGVSLEVKQVKLCLDDEPEDLSDEKYTARHSIPEQEERKRFRNFLQYPPARRNRARSDALISCPEKESLVLKLEGQETLVDVNETPIIRLDEKPTEGTSLNKSLPSYLFGCLDESPESASARRRTISSTRRERAGSGYEDIHSPLLELNNVEPWPRRTFPLSEEEFQQIQSDAPPNCEPVHQRLTRRLAEPSGKVYVGCAADQMDEGSTSRVESRAASPLPSNESVASSVCDDPNDPEWFSPSDISRKVKNRRPTVVDDADPDWTGSDAPKKSKKR